MWDSYDCIVVGGGPGGAWAAKHAAEKGASVLLLEKDREIGIPVRCAEAVGIDSLNLVVKPEDRWISNRIKGAVLVSPHGKDVKVTSNADIGYMLDRRIFDFDLANIAASRGVEVKTKAYVNGLLRDNGAVTGVSLQHLGKEYQISSKIVIGADGIESRVGRWGGLKTNIKLQDLESCLQMTLANIKINSENIYLYFGRDVAPGGYLWVFPKSETSANVGIGISGEFAKKKSAKMYLEEFIEQHFPHAAVLNTVAGGVPCASTLKSIVMDGLMLVGDAAHQVNPVTGGGIVTAMLAGRIAGQVAGKAIKECDVSGERLVEYSDEWRKTQGKNHERMHRIKQAIYKLTDDDINATADSVLALPETKRTLGNIFKKALVKQPAMLFDIMKVFLK